MGLLSATESWRSIRSLRAELPAHIAGVLASNPARLETFHSALEQSQQQLAAAARIGYESRPLNLFYGLSQAGRAIAAASARLDESKGHPWRASGHGVKFQVPLVEDLFHSRVMVASSQRDLFSRVSEALRSPLSVRSATVAQLLTQIPDYWMEFQDPSPVKPPIGDLHFDRATSFPSIHGIGVPGLLKPQTPTPDEISAAISPYPALRRLQVAADDNGDATWIGDQRLRFEIGEKDVERPGGAIRLKGTVSYRRHDFLLPAVEGGMFLKPVPAWWLLLYALSMLARYAPDDWTRVMSLRKSSVASRVEFMLDAALDAIPELVLEALESLESQVP